MNRIFLLFFFLLLVSVDVRSQQQRAFSCDTARRGYEQYLDKEVQKIVAAGASVCLSLFEEGRENADAYALVYWINKNGKRQNRLYYNPDYEKGQFTGLKNNFLSRPVAFDSLLQVARQIEAIPGDTMSVMSMDHIFRLHFFRNGAHQVVQFCEKEWWKHGVGAYDKYFEQLVFYLRKKALAYTGLPG
ncbi:hypothetical protein HNQ91_002003 [Filimonas zeae]|uniref:Uncharacterized protein n=1 Tax=Filimonas zeae TaxID=1737353 RepID=A0A917IXP6_9BACT|nr:hypothetical protein [Filimonas zeae]MDR6338952.1 hypothetical protein [Filimonas zeae]GGH65804.1 hypothetical protein GCM10011379_19340 [Filimonas zeae]